MKQGAVVIGAVATNWALLVENLVLLGPALVTLNVALLVCGFLLAGLLRLDMDMLKIAQAEAQTIAEADPNLDLPEHALLRERVARFWQNAGDVS